MQVTIVPIVIGAFGTITKGLLKGPDDLEVGRGTETIQTTAFLTIRLFSVINRILVGRVYYPSAKMQLVYSTALAVWAIKSPGKHHLILLILSFQLINV